MVLVCVCDSESTLLTKTKLSSPPDTQTVQPQSRNSLMCDNDSQTSPKSTYNTTTTSLRYDSDDDVREAVMWPGCTEENRSGKMKRVYCTE